MSKLTGVATEDVEISYTDDNVIVHFPSREPKEFYTFSWDEWADLASLVLAMQAYAESQL